MSWQRALGVYWRRRPVRVACALLALAAAVYAQYRLANIPLPVGVEKGKSDFTPARAPFALKRELVVEGPEAEGGLLLASEGKPHVAVDARFESARLGDEIMELLRRERPPKPLPPAGNGRIDYTTAGDAEPRPTPAAGATAADGGEPCRTFIRVAAAEGAPRPSELRFFQLKAPGGDQYRYFEMRAVGADLTVELLTRNFGGSGPDDSCRKTLSVGDWRRSFSSPVPLRVVVPAGASFRFSFTPLGDKTPWAGEDSPYEPFELASAPVSASALRVVARDANADAAPVFDAASVGRPLVLRQLLVGRDELQLDFAGRAMVRENGEPARTFNLLKFASENTLLAGLLLMLDTALLEWLRRTVFK